MLGNQLQKLWEVLGGIKVANAQAYLDTDRVMILELVKQSVGFTAIDARVSEFLRDWVLATCQTYLAELLQTEQADEATANACQSVGILLSSFGKLERAAEVYMNRARKFGWQWARWKQLMVQGCSCASEQPSSIWVI